MTDFPSFLRPRLRIFLSADIVGSTGLKQVPLAKDKKKLLDQHTIWFNIIQGFYVEAAQTLADEWNRAHDSWPNQEVCFGTAPRLWKTIGDEVLFEKVVTDYRQVSSTLSCWARALERLRTFLKEKDARLDVKSTAWLAGFPVVNKEVVLDPGVGGPSLTSQSYFTESGLILNRFYEGEVIPGLVIDYVGPAIDTGFRLSQYATTRKLVVSVGIAYVLSKTTKSDDGLIESFRIMFDQPVAMKGVMGGRQYPVFWIDLSALDSLARREDDLLHVRNDPGGLTVQKVRDYCDAFYNELGSYAFKPFIDNDAEQQIKGKPDWYDDIIHQMASNFQSELESLSPNAEDGVDSTGETPTARELKSSAQDLIKQIRT